jgi:hypothetical protein
MPTSISHAVHRSVSVRRSNGQSSPSMIPDSAADTTPAHGNCTFQSSVSHSPHPQSRESGRRPIFLAAFRPLLSNGTSSPPVLEPHQLLVRARFDPPKRSERVNSLELEGSGELLRREKYTRRAPLPKSERLSLPDQVPATFQNTKDGENNVTYHLQSYPKASGKKYTSLSGPRPRFYLGAK